MNETFMTLAAGAAIAVGVAALMRHWGWGMAIPLIAVGAVVSWLPVGPSAPPDPEIVLVIVLAPLVYGEALGSSYLDLRRVSRPVLALAVGLVLATTAVIGAVGAVLVAMPIALAMALGAVLAPTDAVSVSTVARRAGLPRRLVSILEGESLVNDGTGLTMLRVALVAAAAGSVTLLEVTGVFVLAVTMGVLVGAVGGWLLSQLLRRSTDLVAANALVLVAPFLLYALAERLEGSGILAVVVAGLLIAHSQHADPGHTGRVQSTIVWKHITFVLQALAFFLVGLELPDVLRRLDETELRNVLVLVPVVVLALILTRFAFVFVMITFAGRRLEAGRRSLVRSATIVSWAGARGPVSGLAAFSIPVVFASGGAVPYRDVILATTFSVVVITLLLSLTLAPLARLVRIPQDDDTETLRRVDAMLARAAVDRLGDLEAEALGRGEPLQPEVIDRLRQDAERRIRFDLREDTSPGTQELRLATLLTTARAMVRAEQEELIRMRDEEGLPDAIVRPLLRDLDLRDQALAARRV